MARKQATEPPEAPEAPAHLSERAQAVWRDVIYRARSPGRRVYLQAALEALDRADQAARIVDAEGMTTTTKTSGAVHAHPAVKIEREQRALFARLWNTLHLHWDAQLDGRL